MANTKLKNLFFKTKAGNHVYFQDPNWPVYVILAGVVFARLLDVSDFRSVVVALTSATALYWAWLEVSEGVNLFRKILGIVVGLSFLMTLIRDIV